MVDKVIPDVQTLWVGKDFFALFVKFFASMGLKDPLFATVALAVQARKPSTSRSTCWPPWPCFKAEKRTETWFFRGVMASMGLFALFSVADQAFGDRFQLLEHGLFWMVLMSSWIAFKFFTESEAAVELGRVKGAVVVGLVLTALATWSIRDFSASTFHNADEPVQGVEVVDHVWKFDFPFLADKVVWEHTVNAFVADHQSWRSRTSTPVLPS